MCVYIKETPSKFWSIVAGVKLHFISACHHRVGSMFDVAMLQKSVSLQMALCCWKSQMPLCKIICILPVSEYIFSFLFLFTRLQSRNPRSDYIYLQKNPANHFWKHGTRFRVKDTHIMSRSVSYFGNGLYCASPNVEVVSAYSPLGLLVSVRPVGRSSSICVSCYYSFCCCSLYCCVLRMFFHKDKYKRKGSSFFTFAPEMYGSCSFRQVQKLIKRRFV